MHTTVRQHETADYVLVALLAAAASFLAFLYYFRHDQLLLYGDAVAHINIARRVFDSRTPGPLQLGTVWLPLPHVLMLPFLFPDDWWRTGAGGSLVSMLAYVAGTLGIFRLVRTGLAQAGVAAAIARISAWLAAVIYAANPNLIYLQTTAMTESLSLGLFIWASVFFSDWVFLALRGASLKSGHSLWRCGWLLAAWMLTRYDAWFAALVFVLAAILFHLRDGFARQPRPVADKMLERRCLRRFILVVAAAPALWLAYNAAVWRNPLEFVTGPYSARAITERNRKPQDPRHPGWHSPYVAALHFLKAAKLNLGEGYTQTWEKPWLPLALLGSVCAVWLARELRVWLLLWLPLPFYALSVAWGGVPVFIPPWWPYSYYNVRYGIQLLPAVSVFVAVTFCFAWNARHSRVWRALLAAVALLLIIGSYSSVWRSQPISLREALINTRNKRALETRLAGQVRRLPPSATLLMYTGEHVGALQMAGIPLRRTINENNYRLWQAALADPAAHADFLIATAGDPVAAAAERHHVSLQPLATIKVPEQSPVTIYRAKAR